MEGETIHPVGKTKGMVESRFSEDESSPRHRSSSTWLWELTETGSWRTQWSGGLEWTAAGEKPHSCVGRVNKQHTSSLHMSLLIAENWRPNLQKEVQKNGRQQLHNSTNNIIFCDTDFFQPQSLFYWHFNLTLLIICYSA